MYQVEDAEGVIRCLFKKGDELSSKIEASAYLLDHPADGRRSHSPTIYGFAGVLSTFYVRFVNGDEGLVEGVLVEFRENVRDLKRYLEDRNDDDIEGSDLHRMSLLDVRLGNMDRSAANILVEVEGNMCFVPIDHELCLVNNGQGYNLCNPRWLYCNGMDEALAQECIEYVAQLDADADLAFLGDCGWEIPLGLFDRFRIFTTFLKKAVAAGFTPFHIGLMASLKCDNMQFNLEDMVQSVLNEPGEGNFVIRVGIRMDERLEEYHNEIA